ncbi:MAG: hypothetical protein U1F77_11420 [Kiritimatiellia bacterium]
MKPPLFLLVAACLGPAFATRGDSAFSDPANVPPPPAGSIGFASRAADLDVLPGFAKPPPGFGDVGFFWWLGDRLTRERLQWQLDQLAGKGISGLQINYAHDDKGGRTYRLTFPSDPPVFSEDWWSLYQWFLKAAKEKGIAVSLSDYTLGTAERKSLHRRCWRRSGISGATLANSAREVDGSAMVSLDVPANTVSLVAFKLNGAGVVPGSGVDLRGSVRDGRLAWTAPAGVSGFSWCAPRRMGFRSDPMNPLIGEKVIGEFSRNSRTAIPAGRARG